MLTRTSVVWADRIVAVSSSKALRWSSSQRASGYSSAEPPVRLSGPARRRSWSSHGTGRLPAVGSVPAMRRLTLEPAARPTAVDPRRGRRRSPSGWPTRRRRSTTSAALLAEAVALVAGSRPRPLVLEAEPAPDELDAVARAAGFELTRTLLQLRRPLPVPPTRPGRPPAGGAPPLRAFRPGVDDDAWLDVNNRAFAWHPEQSGWTRRRPGRADGRALVPGRRLPGARPAPTGPAAPSTPSAGRRSTPTTTRRSARST